MLSRVQLCGPLDCSLPDSSVHGIFQERLLEWVATSFSRGSSSLEDWTHVSCVSCIGSQVPNHQATREAHRLQQWFKYRVIWSIF